MYTWDEYNDAYQKMGEDVKNLLASPVVQKFCMMKQEEHGLSEDSITDFVAIVCGQILNIPSQNNLETEIRESLRTEDRVVKSISDDIQLFLQNPYEYVGESVYDRYEEEEIASDEGVSPLEMDGSLLSVDELQNQAESPSSDEPVVTPNTQTESITTDASELTELVNTEKTNVLGAPSVDGPEDSEAKKPEVKAVRTMQSDTEKIHGYGAFQKAKELGENDDAIVATSQDSVLKDRPKLSDTPSYSDQHKNS